MKYRLQDIIDIDHFQTLQDRLNKIYSFPSSIIDNDGNILTATAWQNVCTNFHRKNRESERLCIKSDQYILSHLNEAKPAVSYRCPHGLVDNATPIIIDGIHYGNFFTGQFFLEKPDLDFFRAQAKKYGFDEDAYIEAIKEVPIWTQEQLENYLFFIKGLIAVISESGLKKLKEIENRKKIEESEKRHRSILKTAIDGFWLADLDGKLLEVNDSYFSMSGYSEEELLSMRISDLEAIEDAESVAEHMRKLVGKGSDRFESKHRRKDGTIFDVEVNVQFRPDEGGQAVCFIRDITERKQAEARLHKSEETLRAMLNASPLAIVLLDRTGRVLDSNDEHANRFEMTRVQIVGKCIWDFLPKSVESHRKAQVEKVFETGIPLWNEDKRGTIWNEYYIHPAIKNKKGEIEAVIIEALDITERKHAEEVIKEAKIFLDNMSDIAYIADDQGNLVWVNSSVERITGLSPDELIGKPFLPLFIESDHASLIDVYKRTIVGESLENTLTFKSGVTCHFTSLPKRNDKGEIVGTFGVARDITERLIAENELRVSEDRLLRAQAVAKIGNWEYDLSTGQVWGSEEAFRIYGIERSSEYLPLDEVESQILEAKRVNQALIDLITNGEDYDIEFQIKQKRSQKLITIHSIAELIKDVEGKPVKVIGVIQDITDKKNAEEEGIKLLEQLKQAQKMESIGSLAGGIAHDFNNILFPIMGMSEMLLEDLPSGSLLYQNVQEIHSAGNRGSDLVKQILAFSRQSEHKILPVRIQKILREVFKLCRRTIPSDIEIVQNIQSDCALVNADPTQLHQIAMNLITNAYHAVENTGGKISVTLNETKLLQEDLSNSNLEPGRYAVLTISDTGCGIAPTIMDKIFEPYFTTKKKGKGTGLGLAVVYGIVKEHHGDIKVTSEVGKGTSFTVYFPAIGKRSEPMTSDKVEIQPTGDERILLVDDEESVVRLEKQMLQRLGYRVTVHNSATDALMKFRANPEAFDLVVSDMNMPNMTGEQFARKLMAIRPNIPVIICTGFSERIDKEKAHAIGIKGFLMKPVVKSEMAQMIRKVLDEAKASARG